jgi:hypothetical protein
MEASWGFYGPWLGLMLQVGFPLLVLSLPVMFLSERGSFVRRLAGRFALWGFALVLLAVALYSVLRIFEDVYDDLPGT